MKYKFRLIIWNILIKLIISAFENENVIEFSFHDGRIMIKSKVGNPKQEIEKTLLQNSYYNILNNDEDFNKSHSKSLTIINNILYQKDNNIFETIECYDNITFNKIKIDKLHFLINNNTNLLKIKRDGFSFAYNVSENHSITHQLYTSNISNYLSYSIFQNTIIGGYIYFGNVKPLYLSFYKKGVCNMNKNSFYWNCYLSKISINNSNLYPFYYGNYANFQLNKKKMLVPKKFMNYLEENIFKDLIKRHKCNITIKYEKRYIYCDEFITITQLPKLIFDFGNFKRYITFFDLFVCYVGDICYSLFKSFENEKEENWIFTTSFIHHLIVTFDYEKKSVFLYGRYFETINKKHLFIQTIFYILIFILIIGILFLLKFKVQFQKINKKIKKKIDLTAIFII